MWVATDNALVLNFRQTWQPSSKLKRGGCFDQAVEQDWNENKRKREIVSLPLCAQGHSNLLVFLIIWPAVILVQHQTDVGSRSACVPVTIMIDQRS